jgi:hypothetical protein
MMTAMVMENLFASILRGCTLGDSRSSEGMHSFDAPTNDQDALVGQQGGGRVLRPCVHHAIVCELDPGCSTTCTAHCSRACDRLVDANAILYSVLYTYPQPQSVLDHLRPP